MNEVPPVPLPCLTLTAAERAEQTIAQARVDAAAKEFHTHGFLLITAVLPLALTEELRTAYLAEYAHLWNGPAVTDALKVGSKRYMVTVDIKKPFNTPLLYANPFVLPLVKALLTEELVLGTFVSVTSLPGAKLQHLHRDNPLLFNALINRFLPPHAVSVFFPLVEFNSVNGTTRLFPGTHLKNDADSKKVNPVDPVVPVGSCLLVDYRLFHQGTENQSSTVRPMLCGVYQRPWFKDSRNYKLQPYLKISDAEYEAIPEMHRGMLKWIEHYRHGLY